MSGRIKPLRGFEVIGSSRRLVSVIGYGLAAAFGVPALSYPFGRDQGLYDYVGRGILHGMLPYVDAFDHKPPLLYLVYALGAALPLPPMMGVRVIELLSLLVMGHLLARLIEPEPGRAPGGVMALVLVAAHYTNFDWWNSAQTEVWEALFLLGAAVSARRGQTPAGAALTGVLSGLAVGFKPTAALVAVVVMVELALALPEGRRARGLAVYLAGGLGVGLLMVTPWALAGELGTLWDVLVRYNAAHATSDAGHDAMDVLEAHPTVEGLLLGLALLGPLFTRRDPTLRRRGLTLLALAVAASLSVVAQQKYYAYHFSVILPFAVGLAAWGALALLSWLGARWPSRIGSAWVGSAVALLLAVGWAAGMVRLGETPRVGARPPWKDHVQRTVALWRGRLPRDAFLASYRSRHKSPYVSLDIDRLSRGIRSRARAGDTLCVRGYEPGFYALTELWCPSRFAADFALYDDDLVFPTRKGWRAEHQRILAEHPPSFVVTFATKERDRRDLKDKNYIQVDKKGRYVLYQRGDLVGAVPPEAPEAEEEAPIPEAPILED